MLRNRNRRIRHHRYSLGLDLLANTNFNRDVYEQGIDYGSAERIAMLNRHDVIIQTETGWQIIVELFRRWLLLF
ncbi:MAG: hypothetical protein ACRC2S_05150 [Waterburya sp.]